MQEEQEEKKKKEAEEVLMRLKEKNEKTIEKKKKYAELIEKRRKKILDKYLETEERIKKQKDENNKELKNKYLTIAMKREDTVNNLERFERQQEFERQRKINKLMKKDKRLYDLQKQKTEINIKKKELSKNLSNRKQELIGKANTILLSGEYNNVDEIFNKVFNEDELNVIYSSNNNQNENEKNGRNNENENIKNGDAFFTTQQV